MTNPDNKALNATETRNKRGYRIAIILLLLAMLSTFAYVCNKVKMVEPISKEQHLTDSLKFINKAIEVQLGYALADAQSQSARAVKAETAAKQRDTVYLTRIKWIKQAAPIDCQPYLTEMGQECDTLIMMHVFSEMSKDTLLMKKDTVINLYAKKDSVSQLVISEQGKEIKQAHKQTKRAKFWGKAAVVVAVVWTGFVMCVTVVK